MVDMIRWAYKQINKLLTGGVLPVETVDGFWRREGLNGIDILRLANETQMRCYPLVTNIAMENHNFYWENPL